MNTYALAIDTSTRRVSVAIGSDAGLIAEVSLGGAGASGPPRHVEQLAPAIEYVVDAAGVALDQLAVVATCIGPGMFTGLRVGVVTATMLAEALGIPCVGATSLELIAAPVLQRVAAQTATLVVPVMDARRAEVYFSAYRSDGSVLIDPSIGAPSDLVALLGELHEQFATPMLVGDGALRFRHEFLTLAGVQFAGSVEARPSIDALLARGVEGVVQGTAVPVDEIMPLYLRPSDAEINAAVVSGGRA